MEQGECLLVLDKEIPLINAILRKKIDCSNITEDTEREIITFCKLMPFEPKACLGRAGHFDKGYSPV